MDVPVSVRKQLPLAIALHRIGMKVIVSVNANQTTRGKTCIVPQAWSTTLAHAVVSALRPESIVQDIRNGVIQIVAVCAGKPVHAQ